MRELLARLKLRKGILCMLSIHKTFIDAAYYTSVKVCEKCDHTDQPKDYIKLHIERDAWEEAAKLKLDFIQSLEYVANTIYQRTPEIKLAKK